MSSARKTYDTDVITLRRIFANTPGTNTPISSGYVLATGNYGASAFINPIDLPVIATLSTSIGTGGGGGGANIVAPGVCTLSTLLYSGLSSLSTAIGSGIGGGVAYTISSVSTVYSYGTVNISSAVNVFLNPLQLSTLTVSSGNVYTSSLNFKDTVSGTDQLLAVKNGQLQLNGAPIGSGGIVGSFVSTANLASLVSTANLASLVSTSYLQNTLVSTISGLSNIAVTQIIAGSGISINAGVGQVTITNTGGGGGGGITSENLVSTVIGLGTAGYISSASGSVNVSGLISTANLTNLVSTANLTSLVSTANLTNLVSTANLTSLVSTANLTNLVSTSYFAAQLTSTVIGLGSAGYISSASGSVNVSGLISTANLASLVSTANLVNLVSTANLANLVSTANLVNLISTANLANLVSTSYFAAQLTSTVIGLGSAGYISSASGSVNIGGLISTANLAAHVSTANLANLISTANLTSLISTANLANLVSTTYLTSQLTSTVIGLGTAGYISSANLAGHISTANLASLVSTANLASLVSTANLASLVSTANLTNLVSTANLANLVSTTYLTSQLTSTVIGLGNLGYLSSFSSLTVNFSTGFLRAGASQMFTLNFVDTGNQAIQTLSASNNALYFNGTPVGTGAVINYFNTSTYIYQVSSVSTVITQGITFISSATNVILSNSSTFRISTGTIFTSSIVFIDTALNTFQLLAVKNGILQLNGAGIQGGGGPNLVSTANLFSLVSTANLANLVSTANLVNLVSTANLAAHISTANLANLVSTANLANLVSTTYLASQLTSTVIGLGSAGYISSGNLIAHVSTANLANLVSTANLASHISTANLANLVSTANLANLVSTTYLTSQLTSTVVGLGSANYISSLQLLSTSFGINTNISTTFSTLFKSLPTFATGSILYLNQSIPVNSYKQLGVTATTTGLITLTTNVPTGTSNISAFESDFVLPAFIPEGIWDLNIWANADKIDGTFIYFDLYTKVGLVETLAITGSPTAVPVTNTGILEYTNSTRVPSISLVGIDKLVVKVMGSNSKVPSVAITTRYESSFYSHVHTTFGAILPNSLLLNLVSTANLANLVSTANLANLVSTANLTNLVSTTYLASQLTSTVIGLGSAGYISSGNLIGHISTANLANLISTANLANLVSTANLANLVSTANLTNLVSTANLVNLVSTANLFDLVSTANLANLVSTSFFDSQLTSTIIGLGTVNYISSFQLLSTTTGLTTSFVGQQGQFSSLYLNIDPANSPAWISSNTFFGLDPQPEPLAFDVYGSARIIKNLYIGSTTTIIGTKGVVSPSFSTLFMTLSSVSLVDSSQPRGQFNLNANNGSLFMNNNRVMINSNGAVMMSFQIF